MHRLKPLTLISSLLISSALAATASQSSTGFFISPTLERTLRSRGGAANDEIIIEKKKTKRRKKKQDPPTTPSRRSDASSSSSPVTTTKPKKIPKTKQRQQQQQQQRGIKSSSESASRNECLRRLKREWNDAIDDGVAYDWSKMKNVKRRSPPPPPSFKMTTTNDNTTTVVVASSSSAAAAVETNKEYVRIGPFRGNLLRWHFTVTGPSNSAYEGGLYHGRVLLPRNYPGSPPRVQVLTPSGRFQPGADICLTASHFHPESWSPRWTILALVNALRLHMLTPSNEIGGIQATHSERRALALQSRYWKLRTVGDKVTVRTVVDHERLVPLFFEEEEGGCFGDVDEVSSECVSRQQARRACTIVKERDFRNSSVAEKLMAKTTTTTTRQRNTRKEASSPSSHQDMLKFFTRTMFIDVLRNPIKVAFLLFVALIAILNSV